MYCNNCGAFLNDTDSVCPNCKKVMQATVIETGYENGGVKAPKKEKLVEKVETELKGRTSGIDIDIPFDWSKGSFADDDDYLSDVISILKKNSSN